MALALAFASATRSTSSAGSSSPSTSRNENARIGLRSPRGCSVRNASRTSPSSKRAMHRDQRVGRMIAERRRRTRLPPRPRRAPPRCRARRTARRAAAPAARPARRGPPRSPRRSAPASTSRATRCRGTPPRNAERALPSSFADVRVPEHERARHRPFAGLGGALEHERVGRIEPDGAQQLHVRGPRGLRIEPGRRGEQRHELPALDLDLAHAPHQQIAVLVDVAAQSLCRAAGAAGIPSRPRAKPYSCQASLCTIRWRAKLSTSAPAVRSVKPSCFERRRQRIEARLAVAHRDRADHARRTPASPAARPRCAPCGQASRPPPTSPPSTRIASGQSIAIGLSGGA